MSALTAVVRLGSRPPLGGGIEPSHVAHLYGSAWPRFVLYEVRSGEDSSHGAAGPDLARVGTYAPALEAGRSYPLTDLLLAIAPEKSAVSDLLGVLDTKATANYGTSFREKVLRGDVSRGSPAYGRFFEARSQLEAHPYEGVLVVGFHVGVGSDVEEEIRDNAARLDAEVELLAPKNPRRHER